MDGLGDGLAVLSGDITKSFLDDESEGERGGAFGAAETFFTAADTNNAYLSTIISQQTAEQPVQFVPDNTGLPSDTLLGNQWYTGTGANSINVRGVWEDYTGAGVLVGVIDDGFDYTHSDLAPNYRLDLDQDFSDGDFDARDTLVGDRHGTAVMGLIGADDNGTGTVGVAHDADLVGYRVGFGSSPISVFTNALNQAAATVDVVNNSWSFSNSFSDNFSQPGWGAYEASLQNLVQTGRGGLGTITVFSAGNDRGSGHDANYHNTQNSPYTITVGAMDSDGTFSSFSNPGANLLVTAPGTSLQTTDKTGAGGYSANEFTMFSGTSGSAPIVSGVVALILEANPDLGYRDVQEILAYSSAQNDPGSAGWQDNGAGNWNGGGLHFSHDYGFGNVDTLAAVRLAETWTPQQTFATMQSVTASAVPSIAIPDGAGSIQTDINVVTDIDIEHVLITVDIAHAKAGDLVITLVSPDGTESTLANQANNGTLAGGIDNFTFSSVAHWGEGSAGTWTLRVEDTTGGNVGTLNSWGLEFLGSAQSTDDLYIFNDEFGAFSGAELAARSVVSETNGGTDTINLAMVTTASVIDLSAGTGTVAGNAVTIVTTPGNNIESVYGGDGNDTFTGDAADNLLFGERGDDSLTGGGGDDTLDGGVGTDSASFNASVDDFSYNFVDAVQVIATYVGAGISLGIDTLLNIENFSFTDGLFTRVALEAHAASGGIHETITGTDAWETFFGKEGNDIIFGASGFDTIYGDDIGSVYAGNDELHGGDYADTLYGGFGDDTLYGDSGLDTLYGDGGNDILYGGSDFDLLMGGDGDDELHGGTGDDFARGDDGNDILYGEDGNDHLRGMSGNDTLYGGAGDDLLVGALGDDIIYGGAGSDTLVGVQGSDTLVFLSGDVGTGVDLIRQFDMTDTLDLSDVLTAYDPLADLLTDFVRVMDSGSDSVIAVDIDGGGNSFVDLAVIDGFTGLTDEAALVFNGILIV